jgi:hypothetical protein
MRRFDGTGEPLLLLRRESTDEDLWPTSVSPDGSSLLVSRQSEANPAVLIVPIKPDATGVRTPRTILTEGIVFLIGAHFSPDGHWIAFQSEETGRTEIYIRAITAENTLGPKVLISTDGGREPMWAATGPGEPLELLYFHPDRKLMTVSVVATPALKISEPRELFDLAEFRVESIEPMPDGRFMIAQAEEEADEAARTNVVLNWFEELNRLVPADR